MCLINVIRNGEIMNNIITICNNVLEELDKEFPNQKYYSGSIRNIYTEVNRIKQEIQSNNELNFNPQIQTLILNFVDDTTHYESPVIKQLESLSIELSDAKKRGLICE